MIDPHFFSERATLVTTNLELEPLGPQHFDGVWASVNDAEERRLSGVHVTFTEQEVRDYLERRATEVGRADWAIVRASDRAFVGVIVLKDLDPHNESMGFRISLSTEATVVGKGYGSEATKAVIDFGLNTVGLHRITLEVVDFNTRAQRVYGKSGFHAEGIKKEAQLWGKERSDVIMMAVVNSH